MKRPTHRQSWYTMTNQQGDQIVIPMNRAARRAIKKMTKDVGLLPPILRPFNEVMAERKEEAPGTFGVKEEK